MSSNSDQPKNTTVQIPIFPLNLVLFPQGQLSLRIFEPRYLRMVSECLKNKTDFGICLISKGKEVGTAEVVRIGTTAKIVDWQQLPRGMLGIVAVGQERFNLLSSWIEADGLKQGVIESVQAAPLAEFPEGYNALQEFLQSWMDKAKEPHSEELMRDSEWVGMRLAERLPIDLIAKQQLLELDDPVERLEQIYWHMKKFLKL
ncbi:MAG TPA: peptidase S16 [Gammaproteobacteria bacterium]|nr:peptidase S16 [Gammaproteobacteria bacterium]